MFDTNFVFRGKDGIFGIFSAISIQYFLEKSKSIPDFKPLPLIRRLRVQYYNLDKGYINATQRYTYVELGALHI
jgi:hypothetical protein